jgi:hypothetical protein
LSRIPSFSSFFAAFHNRLLIFTEYNFAEIDWEHATTNLLSPVWSYGLHSQDEIEISAKPVSVSPVCTFVVADFEDNSYS